jgi:glycosyltransferase involved in cell wall biosynthesis
MTGPRVAFDVTIARTNQMGSGMYARRLVEALRPLMGERLSAIDCGFATPFAHRKTARDRLATVAHDLWWTQVATVDAARACEAKLLHMPAMLAPVRSTLPIVVTIHDLAILRFPEKFRRWHRTCVALLLPRLARTVDVIVTGSEATKADLVELLGVEPERVSVIPYGIGRNFARLPDGDGRLESVRQRYALPRDYLITVGTIEPRKNLVRLLQAVGLLRSAARPLRNLQLVHVGPVGWHAQDVPRTVAELKLGDHVRFLGFVPDNDLAVLYQLARASVYPSLFEGFGFPVL